MVCLFHHQQVPFNILKSLPNITLNRYRINGVSMGSVSMGSDSIDYVT